MLTDHPQREMLSRELHTRPFPKIKSPASVAYWALVSEGTPAKDRAVLLKLLELMGHGDEVPDGNHFYSRLGAYHLKWERHTEFVSYTLFVPREETALFQNNPHDLFPKEWMGTFDGQVLTSCFLDILGPFTQKKAESYVIEEFFKHFSAESLAVNYVLDREVVVGSDFTMHEGGHIKIAMMAIGQVGENRLGRIVQRLLEIETYKSLAMLTLPIARDIFTQVGVLNTSLTDAVHAIAEGEGTSQERLDALLSVSAKIEYLQSQSAYRFSAVEAYGAIVNQRVEVLREERLLGRQTFAEFMMRRFDPAMRTCESAQARLRDISGRAERASELLATRVTVRTNEQNRMLLKQMDERASLQLRLQETVEGLSVVAISYYAVNLATYLLVPVAKSLNFEKWQLTSALIIPTVLIVWGMIRRVKRHVTKKK